MECPVCDRRGDCRLQDLIHEYGSPEEQLPFDAPVRAARLRARRSSSAIRRSASSAASACGSATRSRAWRRSGSSTAGSTPASATLLERPLDCEFCGQCVNACPVGALVARPYVSDVPVWQRAAATTTCSFCSCGCQITVETRRRRAAAGDLRSGARRPTAASSAPRAGSAGTSSMTRTGWSAPLLRRDGRLVEVELGRGARRGGARRWRRVRDADQPVVGLGSSRLTCEDAYLMQRFLRASLGSPHVDVGPVGGVAALVDGDRGAHRRAPLQRDAGGDGRRGRGPGAARRSDADPPAGQDRDRSRAFASAVSN